LDKACCGQEKPFRHDVIKFINESDKKVKKHFGSFLEKWKNRPWKYFFEEDVFMFHAPVGNTLLLKTNHKVKVFMSGFCVAGEAGAKYVKDMLYSGADNNSAIVAAENTYNTPPMRNGVSKIASDLRIYELLGCKNPAADIFDIVKNESSEILCTQALCPIVFKNGWDANHVWKRLLKSKKLREFASASLQSWYNSLKTHSNEKTRIVLFGWKKEITPDGIVGNMNVCETSGAELIKLLICSKLENQSIEITDEDQKERSLYKIISREFKGKIYIVPHPAYYDVHRQGYMKSPGFRIIQ